MSIANLYGNTSLIDRSIAVPTVGPRLQLLGSEGVKESLGNMYNRTLFIWSPWILTNSGWIVKQPD